MPTEEEIRLRMVIEAQGAVASINDLAARVKIAQNQLTAYSTKTGKSLEETAKGLVNNFKKVEEAAAKIKIGNLTGTAEDRATIKKDVLAEMRTNIQNYSQAMTMALSKTKEEFARTEGSAKSLVGGLSALGNVARFVFSSVLGITAIGILRGIVDWFGKAAQAGYEFSKSLFQLSAGVNAMRRAGTDITFADMLSNIKKIKAEFPIFSIPELVKGASELINLTRDFGFTRDRIFEVQDAIIKLAIINGRAMDDVQRTVALALSSGYTEGLQRLGVSINRINIATKAASLGYAEYYNALTEVERAEATAILLLEKTAKYQNDLNEYQKKFPGLIDASNASLKDMSTQIGVVVLPIWALFMRTLQHAADFFTRFFGEALPNILGMATDYFARMVFVFQQGWEIISGEREEFDFERIAKQAKAAADLVKGYFSGDAFKLPEPEVKKGGLKEFTDEQLDAYESAFRDLMDLKEDYDEKLKDLEINLLEDLAKIDREYLDRRKEIWDDYNDDVAKINADAAQEIADAEKDLAQSIEDAHRDTQSKLANAGRKYREEEIKAERDYQEKLRRLREEFLFDLEDALRQRDALQVLRLIRRYNLDKEQLNRQNEDEKQERADNYRSELADIRRQAAEKLRELQIEHQRRLEEIEAQRQRELAEAEKKREEELAQEKEDWLTRRNERIAQYGEELKDLKDWLTESLTTMAEKFVEMEGVTFAMASTLAETIKAVFGNEGLADIYFGEFNTMLDSTINNAIAKKAELEELLKEVNALRNSILTGSPLSATLDPSTLGLMQQVNYPGHANGVQNQLLTSPQLFMAGEVPEVMSITPVSQLNSSSVGGNGSNGKGTVEINLGAGLEGRIIDSTLEQFDMILRKELEKR